MGSEHGHVTKGKAVNSKPPTIFGTEIIGNDSETTPHNKMQSVANKQNNGWF